jgi:hypothetical protein
LLYAINGEIFSKFPYLCKNLKAEIMGLYLNPNADAFMEDKGTRIYVDKSLLIRELNSIVSTKEDFVCLSRPRRFGKSMAGNMISAYYSKGCDMRDVFSQMKLGQEPCFDKYLNKFNVIKLDLNGWYQRAIQRNRKDLLLTDIHETLVDEFKVAFPALSFCSGETLDQCILKVYAEIGEKFVIIIDE